MASPASWSTRPRRQRGARSSCWRIPSSRSGSAARARSTRASTSSRRACCATGSTCSRRSIPRTGTTGREMPDQRLVIVSNRGPAQFERGPDGDRTVQRGGGGLVTALSGLVAHRGALWIASAMTDEDVAVSREAGGDSVQVELDDVSYDVLLVESEPEAYDRFYNVIANPLLWFVQHYLWDLSNAPDIRQSELDAWDGGYKVVNEDIAQA